MGALCREPQTVAQGSSHTSQKLLQPPGKTEGPQHDAFPIFSQLPPEIRLKIWNLNLPTQRLVSISCSTESSPKRDAQAQSSATFIGCTSNAPIPVNLHVCAEARTDALKRFRCAFGFARMPGHVLFNPDSDILHFGTLEGYMAAVAQFNTCMIMCDPAQLALVRRIAISDALFWGGPTYNSMTAARVTVDVLSSLADHMPGLEQVMFVLDELEDVHASTQTEERITRQVEMAMATVCQQRPSWRPPPWAIISLQTLRRACS